MKILLINPPRSPENGILKYAPEEARYFIHKKLIGPPLGLLIVARALKDYDVTLFDAKGEYDLDPHAPPLNKMTISLLNEIKPDIVGVTTIASEFDYAMDIFNAVKEYNPDILTVAGGLHTSLCFEDFNHPAVDVICPGQSAFFFRDIIEAKKKGITLEKVPGIIINKNNKLIPVKGAEPKYILSDIDALLPERDHLKRWKQTYIVGNSPSPTTYLYTSLGCPYKCSFCSIWKQLKGVFYQRSIDNVINELKSITDYDIIRFADANTIVNIDFINELFDRIEKEGIKKEYIMDIRADTAVKYPELIEKLAKNGLKVVICGFESFRDEELKRYNKKSTVQSIEESINIFHQNDIMLRGNYVIPCDYSEDDFKALAEYASSHKVTYAGYTILTPMPGTQYYNEVEGQIIDHDLKKYNFFNAVMKTKIPLEKFYENVAKLWLIKKGKDII